VSEHAQKTLEVVMQSAKSSDKAGLNHMAGAINAFHKDTKSYPANLQSLYPKYIPLKAFIDELNWNYQSRGDGFVLSKSVEVRGRTMVASIDQNMKISSTAGTLVARATAPGRPAATTPPPASLSLEQVLKPLEMAGRADQPERRSQPATPVAVRDEPRSVEEDTALDPTDLAGRSSRDFLVWRQPDGSLGFGNVQYPKAQRLYVATADRWYRIEQRPIEASATAPHHDQRPVDAADTVSTLTSGTQYLAWKDKNGVIGFGNVQYPGADVDYVHVNGRWEKAAN